MVAITCQDTVDRGTTLNVSVLFTEQELKGARSVSIMLEHKLTYPNPCENNFSPPILQKKVFEKGSPPGQLQASFDIPKKAAPTFEYGPLKSEWVVDVKTDIPMWFDKHSTKTVNVRR